MIFFKNNMTKSILVCLLSLATTLHCQNYTFRTYLNDGEIAGTIKHNFNVDTIQKYIGQFHDRLGYQYYLYQSVLKNQKDKKVAIKYLDSAFARGLDTLCVPPLVHQIFGDSVINKSHAQNFLKAYDLKLMKRLDSLVEQDQKYRQLAFVKGKRITLSDSLHAQWKLTDSLNLVFLKALIKREGYPTARKVGYDFCMFGPRTAPELIIRHLGTNERDYQIALLKQVVELCLKNEEHWQKIGGIQFNLHFRFSNSYSEFTSLYYKGKSLDVEESLFSLSQMAEILQSPIQTVNIKCASARTFNELKAALLELNWSIPLPPNQEELVKLFGIEPRQKMLESQVIFEKDKSIPFGKVYYKIVELNRKAPK
jgi:hypothetical protein